MGQICNNMNLSVEDNVKNYLIFFFSPFSYTFVEESRWRGKSCEGFDHRNTLHQIGPPNKLILILVVNSIFTFASTNRCTTVEESVQSI